jgi:uncharacterized protein YndB with AHSA1/START domain
MHRIARERHVAAPAPRVFAVVADHERMPEWFPAREVVRRRPGAAHPDGVGALRVVRGAGLAVEEAVTAFEPGRRLAWVLVAGAPLRSARSEVELRDEGDGTRVRWSVDFEAPLPGTAWLARRALSATLVRALEGLARRCEAAPSTTGG